MKDRIRGCYIQYCDVMNPGYQLTGIDKKVLSQVAEFNKAGIECELRYCPRPVTFLSKALSCLPFAADGVGWPKVEDLRQMDFLYIRRPVYASVSFLEFLQKVRAQNPKALVLYEIPTFPYDDEMRGFNRIALMKDRHHRNKMKGLVDYVVDLSGHDRIFGMPTVRITNGIDFDKVPMRDVLLESNVVNVLAVASFEPWHGIDRFVEGMAAYYSDGGDREIKLHLAGAGSQVPALRKLAKAKGLENRVVFYGPLDQDGLGPLYDRCDIGIECLGIHRRDGTQRSASIKSREYLAKGLPFIYSAPIDGIEGDEVDFCDCVSQDDRAIDLEEVLAFRDRLYDREDARQLAFRIRAYGAERVSMRAAMRNVLELLGAGTYPDEGEIGS